MLDHAQNYSELPPALQSARIDLTSPCVKAGGGPARVMHAAKTLSARPATAKGSLGGGGGAQRHRAPRWYDFQLGGANFAGAGPAPF